MRQREVTVSVPARLHLGFIDLHGGLGRRFASLGLTLDAPTTEIAVRSARGLGVHGAESDRVRRYVERLARHFAFEPGFEIAVARAIPGHSGLGSGTQLALGLGLALCRLLDIEASLVALAQALGRGERSGIGIGAFEQGGVLLDGGKGDGPVPPPIVARLPFPEDWRVLLIHDRRRAGVHGESEIAAFGALPRFPEDSAARLARVVLLRALPALAERDLAGFGAAVGELQRTVGDHFAPAQGGRYASPAVAEVLGWLAATGLEGLGQSSWGPTGFALLPSAAEAARMAEAARARWSEESGLGFEVRQGRNHGVRCETREVLAASLAGSS